MRVRFIGDPNDGLSGPDTLTQWGVEFTKGKWTEADDSRFARHSHFEVDDKPPRGRRASEEEGA